jgi:hypothetical protein
VQAFPRSSAIRRAAALAGAGALLIPLAGCGSSSSSSSSTKSQTATAASSSTASTASTASTPTAPQSPKRQYVTKAGVVCQQLAEEIRTVGTNAKPLKQKGEELLVMRERALARLKALPVPKGDNVAGEWLRARTHAIALEREVVAKKEPFSPANTKLNHDYSEAFVYASHLAAVDRIVGCKGEGAA